MSKSLQQAQRSNQSCDYTYTTNYTGCFLRYSLSKILLINTTTARSNQGHTIMFHTKSPTYSPYLIIYFYPIRFLRHTPNKNKVATAKTKVKLRSHNDFAHLHTQCSCPELTNYTLWVPRCRLDKSFCFYHQTTFQAGWTAFIKVLGNKNQKLGK